MTINKKSIHKKYKNGVMLVEGADLWEEKRIECNNQRYLIQDASSAQAIYQTYKRKEEALEDIARGGLVFRVISPDDGRIYDALQVIRNPAIIQKIIKKSLRDLPVIE